MGFVMIPVFVVLSLSMQHSTLTRSVLAHIYLGFTLEGIWGGNQSFYVPVRICLPQLPSRGMSDVQEDSVAYPSSHIPSHTWTRILSPSSFMGCHKFCFRNSSSVVRWHKINPDACPISRYREIATIKTATMANVEAINCSGRALWGSDEIFRLGRGGNLKDKNDLIFYGLKVGNILIISAPASYPNSGHTAFYSSKDS